MIVGLLLTLASACVASKLPVVDLGYELHQAISFNVSQVFLAFGVELYYLTFWNRAPMASIISVIFAMQHLQLVT